MFKFWGRKSNSEREYDRVFYRYLNGRWDELSDIDREILCENRVKIDNENITIRNICAGLGVAVPEQFESIADEPQRLAFRPKKVKKGDVCLFIRSAEDFGEKTFNTNFMYEQAIEKGAKLIIMGEKDYKKMRRKRADFPVIIIDHLNIRIYRFFSQLREQQKAKVVMLTGSVGKTTTKELCSVVAKNSFPAFANKGNTNTVHQTAYHAFYNTNDVNEVYIQECGLGYRGSVRMASQILQPDIFILTNVMEHHLEAFKTMDRLFHEKISPVPYLRKDGLVITNFDDERIREYDFIHKVKSFGIQNPDVDYHARNIRQEDKLLCLDIYDRENDEVTSLAANLLGEHNAYNIMAAFALGKALGLSNETIKSSILDYSPSGIRQNLVNIGGVNIIMDCYNVAEASILSLLKIGEQFKVEEGAKKYALIGGENTLGKEVVERSEAFGYEVAKHKMDGCLFCGKAERDFETLNHFGDAASIMKTFSEVSDTPNQFAANIEEMETYLKENVKCGDLVMVKGIYYLEMPIAVDKAFGSSFSFKLSNYKEQRKKLQADGYEFYLIESFGEVEVADAPLVDGTLTIPNEIDGYPVFRITDKAFLKKEDITKIDFGTSIKNIGRRAFRMCDGLVEVVIPANVKVIEKQAFAKCESLERVVLENGVTHIGSEAFAGCSNLKEVVIPVSVGMIEEDAFAGCEQVQLVREE